jgi:hypothetical protein
MPAVRRLLRITFNALTVLSLVMAILVAGLWVRSYWRVDVGLVADPARVTYRVTSHTGRIGLNVQYSAFYPNPGWYFGTNVSASTGSHWADVTVMNDLGFSLRRPANSLIRPPPPDWRCPRWIRVLGMRVDLPVSSLLVTVPHWFAVAALLVLPAKKVQRRWRDHRRRAIGLCHACGYDLRATPERCPECGTAKAA